MKTTIHSIAVLGAGRMGIMHVEALAKSSRWDLRYVVDPSADRLKLAGELVPGAKLVGDIDAVLADPSLEAVSINTLSDIRPELIRRAVRAGKHVLCEKPLAPSAAEAEQLVKDLRGSDRLVTVNLFNRNAANLRQARQFLEEGAIGQLAVVRISHVTPYTRNQSRLAESHRAVEGHVLHDCGMHYVDVLRWFTGSEFGPYQALATRFWDNDYENHFMVQGRMQSGVAFDFHNSFCYTTLAEKPRNWSVLELIGTRGVITARHDFVTATLQVNGAKVTVEKSYPYGGKKLDVYYDRFAEAIETGDLGSLPRVEDAVIASRVAQAMVDQALAGPVPNFGSADDLLALPVEREREVWG